MSMRQHSKRDLELPVTSRYHRDITERLLKATLSVNKIIKILKLSFLMLKSVRWIKNLMSYPLLRGSFSHEKNQQNDMCSQRTQISLGICPV